MEWWKQRETWLVGMLIAVVVFAYPWLRARILPTVPADLLQPPGDAAGRGVARDAVSEVLIDRLTMVATSYDPSGRNLFQYGKPPTPPKPPAPPPPTLKEVQDRDAQKRQQERVARILEEKRKAAELAKNRQQNMQPRPPAQPSAARPPAAKYKFMGYMGNPNRKLAVLLDDGEVVLKREGETLGDDFVVREIRFDSVELGYTDERFKDEKTLIPMGN